MVRYGPRPAHRRGTSGSRWDRYRAAKVRGVTHCQNPRCGRPLVTDAPCTHPRHQHMPGCPTHPAYPTIEHPRQLIDGGTARDPDALVYCYSCNSRGGPRRQATPTTPGPSRQW